jgi:hypothetical protein
VSGIGTLCEKDKVSMRLAVATDHLMKPTPELIPANWRPSFTNCSLLMKCSPLGTASPSPTGVTLPVCLSMTYSLPGLSGESFSTAATFEPSWLSANSAKSFPGRRIDFFFPALASQSHTPPDSSWIVATTFPSVDMAHPVILSERGTVIFEINVADVAS